MSLMSMEKGYKNSENLYSTNFLIGNYIYTYMYSNSLKIDNLPSNKYRIYPKIDALQYFGLFLKFVLLLYRRHNTLFIEYFFF